MNDKTDRLIQIIDNAERMKRTATPQTKRKLNAIIKKARAKLYN